MNSLRDLLRCTWFGGGGVETPEGGRPFSILDCLTHTLHAQFAAGGSSADVHSSVAAPGLSSWWTAAKDTLKRKLFSSVLFLGANIEVLFSTFLVRVGISTFGSPARPGIAQGAVPIENWDFMLNTVVFRFQNWRFWT